MNMASLARQIIVVPIEVIVLFGLHIPPRRWTGTVGPSLHGLTIAPFVDYLLCYSLTRRSMSILQDNPKI
jgi:hypothetical protein